MSTVAIRRTDAPTMRLFDSRTVAVTTRWSPSSFSSPDEACPHPHLQEMRRLDVSGRGAARQAFQLGQTRTVPFSGVNLSALERKLRMIYMYEMERSDERRPASVAVAPHPHQRPRYHPALSTHLRRFELVDEDNVGRRDVLRAEHVDIAHFHLSGRNSGEGVMIDGLSVRGDEPRNRLKDVS